MIRNYKEKWENSLPSETDFWRSLFEKTSKHQNFIDGFENRFHNEPKFLFDSEINYPEGSLISVLDVGAGPLSHVGRVSASYRVHVTAIDPLADQYWELWKQSGRVPRIPTIYGLAEQLDKTFCPKAFDFVYCRNALDHMYDPLLSVKKMINISKSMVFICGHKNEGEKEKYSGLHAWNCEPSEGNDLRIWNREVSYSLKEELDGKATIESTDGEWFSCKITPAP